MGCVAHQAAVAAPGHWHPITAMLFSPFHPSAAPGSTIRSRDLSSSPLVPARYLGDATLRLVAQLQQPPAAPHSRPGHSPTTHSRAHHNRDPQRPTTRPTRGLIHEYQHVLLDVQSFWHHKLDVAGEPPGAGLLVALRDKPQRIDAVVQAGIPDGRKDIPDEDRSRVHSVQLLQNGGSGRRRWAVIFIRSRLPSHLRQVSSATCGPSCSCLPRSSLLRSTPPNATPTRAARSGRPPGGRFCPRRRPTEPRS